MTLTNFPGGVTVDGYNSPTAATIAVGTEAANVINVTVQLVDGAGDDLDNVATVLAYLSDDSGGAGVAATAPDGGVAIGTDGNLGAIVAGKVFLLTSESDGDIDIDITESGADTFYLVVVLPSGKTVVSGAITFAA